MRAPISVCLIVRDEFPHIEKTFQSIRDHVEELVVVDTGSTDETPEVAKKYADRFEVFTGCNDASGRIADFSMARERSFSLATKPWVMWLDGDDTVENPQNLKVLTDRHQGTDPCMLIFPYDYSHDAQGRCTCTFYRERVVHGERKHFQWKSPIHEVLAPVDPSIPKFICEEVRITHWRSRVAKKVNDPTRNLRILKDFYAKVGESDARVLYYLGLEYGYAGQVEESLMMHKRYCALSGWEDEKMLSMMEICRWLTLQNKFDEAVEWALKAMVVKEDWGEPYLALTKAYYFKALPSGNRRDWERCAYFAKRYLASDPTRTVLFINPLERAVDIHRYLNQALNFIGDVKGALDSVDAALAVQPEDTNLEYNRALYVEHMEREAILAAMKRMHSVGKASDDQLQIVEAVIAGKFKVGAQARALAANANEQARIVSAVQAQAGAGPGLDVSFYVGPGPERWNPETMAKTGMGGSEAMAYELSKRLAARGHRVTVYGDCAGMEGTFDGVRWLDHPQFAGSSCDVLVASRRPQVLGDEAHVTAKARFLWVHDVHCGPELNYARALRADRILCLSEWHRQYFLDTYKHVHPSQVLVTRNGVDLSLYDQQMERDPKSMFYSSSPDRGMEVAVRLMPRIRAQVPGAQLHIYYGFDNWEKYAPPEQQKTIEMLKQLLRDHEQHGVVFHGRVDQKTLAAAQLSSNVWAYPTWFSETNCITGAQAQIAGCRIVTSPIAALNETVGHRGKMIPGDWLSAPYQDAYVNAIVTELGRSEEPGARESLMAEARQRFDLDSLADDWHLMFYRVLRELESRPLPPYMPAMERAA